MTDLNALIKRLERNSGYRNERWECVTDPTMLAEAAQALRTLAERQPVGDGEVELTELERLLHENNCLHSRIEQLDYPCSPHCDGYLREMKLRREMEAAEQRGADRAFEEAAGIASKYESNHNHERAHAAYQIAAAIRQRIGGQP